MSNSIVVMVIAGICSSGCASSAGEAGGIGVGVGLLVGAVAGIALGGKAEDMAKGAALGAVVGGVIGYAYGAKIDSQLEALKGEENDINTQLTVARNINAAALESNERSRVQLAELRTDLAELQRQGNAKTLTLEQLQAEKNKFNEAYATATSDLNDTERALTELRSVNTSNSPDMDAEIAKLTEQRDMMKETTQTLASLNQRI